MGFHPVGWDREGKKGGGLLTLVRENICLREITLSFTGKNEVGLINIKLEENRWLFVVNYYNRATADFDLNHLKKVNNYCEK